MNELPNLSPEMVARWICFDRNDRNWTYDPMRGRTIQNLQAQGVAGIWNLLARPEGFALLADEVGMGKTLQALSVFGLLWVQQPGARILVVAPNQSVAENWVTEYKGFVRDHYRFADDVVKCGNNGEPIHMPVLCTTLEQVVSQFVDGDARIVITKISIFSNLVELPEKAGMRQKAERASESGADFRERILTALGVPLDLLVIDEAHYLRNVRGGSQRVAAASAFFGKPNQQVVASRVLLMTATPNHTTNDDVSNVVSYFQVPEGSTAQVLEKHAIRRLRLLEDKNKYQYREENAHGCSFEDDVPAEIFFALYQRELAEAEDDGVPLYANERRSFLYGYLEGFETFRGDTEATDDDADDRERSDYRMAPDSEILRRLAGDHYRIEGASPRHPKYDKSMDEVVPAFDEFWSRKPRPVEEDKHLVFVRRIPSCRELAARANEAYDALFLRRIGEALDLDPDAISRIQSGPFRSQLNQRVRERLDDADDNIEGLNEKDVPEEEGGGGGFAPSRIMDYFRKVKGGDPEATHGFLFRQRFQRTREPFVLFFEPPWDPGWPNLPNSGSQPNYREWIQNARLAKLEAEHSEACRLLGAHWKSSRSGRRNCVPEPGGSHFPTLAGIYHRHMGEAERAAWDRLVAESPCVQEAFFQTFLRKGLLLASAAVVELYAWYLRSRRTAARSETVYAGFCREVDRNFDGSLTQGLMARAIASFRGIAEGFCGISSHAEILKYSWNELNGHDPGAFCSGEIADRGRLITSFNTPFFPNVLVATSVLQEGVNLHTHCRKVVHYGIAWTPGDNEQRVGRVDRLYGSVHRNIKAGVRDRLSIRYPYLVGSFDEDQVGQFIVRKHAAEKVLDRGETISTNKAIDVARTDSDWRNYLRRPDDSNEAVDVPDPYPYRDGLAVDKDWDVRLERIGTGSDISEHVSSLLRDAVSRLEFDGTCHVLGGFDSRSWFVEPMFRNRGAREHQPVVVSLEFFPEFAAQSHRTVYCLQMRSPLFKTRPEGLEEALLDLDDRFPLVQVVCDPNSEDSHFHYHARGCLPVFVDTQGREDCSSAEIADVLRQVILGAEELEARLLAYQDLSLEQVQSSPPRLGLEPSKDIEDGVRSSWERADTMVWENDHQTARLRLGWTARTHLDRLELQGRHPFLFGQPRHDGRVAWELRFPGFDIQASEETLLSRWGGFLIKNLGVSSVTDVMDRES